VYGRSNWNDVPQNNKFVCAIPDFYTHKISSDITRFLQDLDRTLLITVERPCLHDLFRTA